MWVLRTYDHIYTLNRPFSFYYLEPYATQLQAGPVCRSIQSAEPTIYARFPPGCTQQHRRATRGGPSR